MVRARKQTTAKSSERSEELRTKHPLISGPWSVRVAPWALRRAFGFDPLLLAKLAEIPKALEARKPKDRVGSAGVRLHVPAHNLDPIHVSFIQSSVFGPEVISVDAVLMPMRI